MPKFSIITPTFNRADGRLQRCINSVRAQTFRNYEHIIVDDGSKDGTTGTVDYYRDRDTRIQYIEIEHSGRVIARNEGMKRAKGKYLYWADSDDALDPMCLATFDYYTKQEPDARLWVCSRVKHGMIKEGDDTHLVPKYSEIFPAWMPPLEPGGETHSNFNSGKVGTGMFLFHRECLDKTGLMPPWKNHYEVADGINEWLGYETIYSAKKKWVGNPWGSDFAMFRKLTMFYRVHLIKAALYIHYVR